MGPVGAAMTLMELGRPEEAVRLLRGIAPGVPIAALTLARVLVQKNPSPAERLEARAILTGLTAKEPGNAAAWVVLGRVESLDGNRVLAVRCFERALALNADERTAAYQLMLLYRTPGRAADAARMSAKVRDLASANRDREAGERYRLSAKPE